MLAGHYAPAYLLRVRFPDVPLLALFLAVQASDIIFFILVPLGIERVAVDPAVRGPLGMDLLHMPYTHSFTLTLLYAAIAAGIGTAFRHWRVGVALALAVLSHWGFDAIVHEPDLPLTPDGARRIGLGLWREASIAYALEIGLVVVSSIWLARRVPSPSARRWIYASAAVLVLIHTRYVLVPPPESPTQLALGAEIVYLVMAAIAWIIDRKLTHGTSRQTATNAMRGLPRAGR